MFTLKFGSLVCHVADDGPGRFIRCVNQNKYCLVTILLIDDCAKDGVREMVTVVGMLLLLKKVDISWVLVSKSSCWEQRREEL